MNLYRRLRDLLPQPPLQVGDVVAVDAGTVTIELPGGGRVQAYGDVTLGARVFFRAGAVEGPAPALPLELIDV